MFDVPSDVRSVSTATMSTGDASRDEVAAGSMSDEARTAMMHVTHGYAPSADDADRPPPVAPRGTRQPPSGWLGFDGHNEAISCLSAELHLTHKRTNEHTDRDKRTDTKNRILCIFALKCDIWWQYFNDFFMIIN